MSKKELIELLTKLLGTLSPLVLRQIDNYVAQGLTHKDIARAVYYIFDVLKKVPIDSTAQYGIGLVPSYVGQANAYYEKIKRQQEQQAKQVEDSESIQTRFVSPQKRVKIKKEVDINEL
jgi:hypothetical protein